MIQHRNTNGSSDARRTFSYISRIIYIEGLLPLLRVFFCCDIGLSMDDAKDLFGVTIEVVQGIEQTLPWMGTSLSKTLANFRDGKGLKKLLDAAMEFLAWN